MRHLPATPAPHATPPPVADDLVAAARAFFPDATEIAPIAGREHLARVETPARAWRVRRWPAGTTEASVTFVHAVLDRAREAGIDVAPAVARRPPPAAETTLTLDNHRYDAQSWLPGRPLDQTVEDRLAADRSVDLPAVLPDAVFAALVETVARLHEATAALARTPDAPAAPLSGLVEAVRRAWTDQRRRLRPIAPTTPPVQRWLATGERALPAAEAALAADAPAAGRHRAVLHLGLWPAHVLLDGAGGEPRLVGLIGWEGSAAGSPLLDLAQLVLRCRGWSAGAAEAAIAAYGAVRHLAPEERRLLPAVAALDLIATAGHLLDLAYAPRPADAAPPSSALRAGATALVNSLEVATTTLVQTNAPLKPAARRSRERRPSPKRPAGQDRPGGGRRDSTRRSGSR